MIAALNFKPFDKGALKGFFDMRYHGLTIKGCRLMNGSNGLWVSFPQMKGEQDGEVKYFDQMFLTPPEADHVKRLVIADLQAQGHLERPRNKPGRKPAPVQKDPNRRLTPEGEDVTDYYSEPNEDIGF